MSTYTSAPPRRRVGHRVLKVALAAGLAVLVLLLITSIWFYSVARHALPMLDGTIVLPGLSNPLTVIRDAQGVPHISAATLDDLFFAQGYVTAQDRLWQMDTTRRYAAGELSEILGPKYIEADTQQRTLLLKMAAEQAETRLTARDRGYLEAYARGVNAYINSARGHLSIEFRVLGYSPRPWTALDSLLVGAGMSQMLADGGYQHALSREKIIAKIGPELATDLYPNSSWRDHPPVADPDQESFEAPDSNGDSGEQEELTPPAGKRKLGKTVFHRRRHSRRQRAELIPSESSGYDPLTPGSNNWVISGAHTASGKPILSNDMHLPHRIPGIWYEAHLTSGSFDVAGVTLPGVPFVIVGHNQRISWGFTNIAPSVQDIFIETFNDSGQYLTPDGWVQPQHLREEIKVRGGKNVSIDVAITRHGPIITGLIPGETRKLALKWTIYDPAAVQVPFFDIDSAQNWDEFRLAFSHFGSPAQNVVYADVDGHIGYQATGFIPVRASGNSSLPVSGSDNAHEWTGYVPFDKLPAVFDPPSGIIATANGRITAEGYPFILSNEWGPPYRTERIYRILAAAKKFAPSDMLPLQTDIYSDFDRFCAERFAYAIDHTSNPSQRVRQAAEIMRDWDGRLTADSSAATIVVRSRQELMRLLLAPRLGQEYDDYHWMMSAVWLENTLLHQPPRWLPSQYPSYDDLLTAAVEAALKHAPHKLTSWQWGNESHVQMNHPIFGMVPLLRRWTGPGRHPQSGNGYTVKQVGPGFGPSERMTVDLSNLDGTTLNIVLGQSGHIFSPHYKDQWSAWYTGTSFLFAFSPAAVEKAVSHKLILQPAK